MVIAAQVPQVIETLSLHLLVGLDFILGERVHWIILLVRARSWVRWGAARIIQHMRQFGTLLDRDVRHICICVLLAWLAHRVLELVPPDLARLRLGDEEDLRLGVLDEGQRLGRVYLGIVQRLL